jgi:arsenate reductase
MNQWCCKTAGIMRATASRQNLMIVIYHNPRCSKSRAALERVQQFAHEHAMPLSIVDYQATPLTLSQLKALHRTLQGKRPVPVRDMVRDGEDLFASLRLDEAEDDALLAALAAHPSLLQRPIVTCNGRGVIARPPEMAEHVLTA